MGVSGSGKSTVGAALAQRLGCPSPTPTTSTRRRTSPRCPPDCRWTTTTATPGWRHRRVARRAQRRRRDELLGAQRQYRDQLRDHARAPVPPPRGGLPEVIGRRQAGRPGHFMPASLLASQFADPRAAGARRAGVAIDVDQTVDALQRSVYVALDPPEENSDVHRPPLVAPAATALPNPSPSGWSSSWPRSPASRCSSCPHPQVHPSLALTVARSRSASRGREPRRRPSQPVLAGFW